MQNSSAIDNDQKSDSIVRIPNGDVIQPLNEPPVITVVKEVMPSSASTTAIVPIDNSPPVSSIIAQPQQQQRQGQPDDVETPVIGSSQRTMVTEIKPSNKNGPPVKIPGIVFVLGMGKIITYYID